MAWSNKNVAAGGQVYSWMTGTWVGETKGTVGGPSQAPSSPTKVWHNANGVVGVEVAPQGSVVTDDGKLVLPKQPSQSAGRGNGAPAAAAPGNGAVSLGPGNPGVTTGGGGGGNGPGEASAGNKPGAGPAAPVVTTGPLTVKTKNTATGLQIGLPGGWATNPKWSDTAEWEERYGEPGDWLGGIVTMGVDLGLNLKRFDDWSKVAIDEARAGFWADAAARVNGPLPPQEPVDWGH